MAIIRRKKHGDEHGNTKFTREQVQEWRDWMRPPHRLNQKQVAAKFGVRPALIAQKFEEFGI